MQLIALCRLGRDADIRQTADGLTVANLALAYSYGKKQDGKRPTQWINAALFGKRADSLAPYLTKGTAIVAYLSDVHIEHFNKSDGTQGTALKARLNDLEFAGGGQQQTPQQQNQQQPQSTQQQYQQASGGGQDPSGDIPFRAVDWRLS